MVSLGLSEDGGALTAPARWWLGPPPPRAVTLLTRVLQLAVAALALTWVLGYLGGLGLSPRPLAGGGNDTGPIFNWHPLLLTAAFPLLMAEAVLAYKAPLVERRDRDATKIYHFALHTAALACTIVGVTAAFVSHTAKRPDPIPNLYSVHSWLGLAVLTLLTLQYAVGAFSYLWPKLSLAQRHALGPLHRFLGKAAFAGGIATMAVGIQEKATFVQAFNKPPSLHASILALPAALVVLLLALALAVLYHHAPAAVAPAPASGEQERLIASASSGGGGPAAAEGDHAQDYDDLHSA
ncbi:hypothetical protein ABPG77_010729 [Micractinium sp. CCAP 211/92]